MNNRLSGIYVWVILPLKYRGEATYLLPEQMVGRVVIGSRVRVDFGGKEYLAVVKNILSDGSFIKSDVVYKEVISVEEMTPVLPQEMELWEMVADYYLCSVGEVYKAAYPAMSIRQEQVKSRKTAASFFEAVAKQGHQYEEPQLSAKQKEVFGLIKDSFAKPLLLHGVTGSGKTEIYVALAIEQLKRGKSVLYMAPEIAITKQLQTRLKRVFGERVLVFHSKQSAVEKKRIHKILEGSEAVVVLGTRSALFLPYRELGLVIVDEEHDSSYKQTEPSPRYQARDVAVMLANIYKANLLLGSATPSFETLYNCKIGRFAKVELLERFYGAANARVEVIDTIQARKTGQMRGSFSQKLINIIKKRVSEGKQVLLFKNRRSYSPVVECTECGESAKCPHCNVNLSFHKYNSTLRCHYCDYSVKFYGICQKCGLDSLRYKGAGTERLEEELKEIIPEARIARFDADIASSKRAEEAVIRDFSEGNIDILIGTQMISKGFDFKNLKLVAIIDADSLLAMQDFRADERALQMFNQLLGRAGRRDEAGELLLQTNCKRHPVIESLVASSLRGGLAGGLAGGHGDGHGGGHSGGGRGVGATGIIDELMEQRREFSFTPFVRMVKITVKHSNQQRLDILCDRVKEELSGVDAVEVTGPFVPQIDRVRGEWVKAFYVKFARNMELKRNKAVMLERILSLKCGNAIIIDVDPL